MRGSTLRISWRLHKGMSCCSWMNPPPSLRRLHAHRLHLETHILVTLVTTISTTDITSKRERERVAEREREGGKREREREGRERERRAYACVL